MHKVEALLERIREESFLKDIPEDILTDIEAKVNRRSDEIEDKIRFITENNLLPSIKTLMHWLDGQLPPRMRAEVAQTVQSLSESVDTLKPVVELHESNLRRLARKVCLVTDDKKLEHLCKLALGGTGVQFSVISSGPRGQNPQDDRATKAQQPVQQPVQQPFSENPSASTDAKAGVHSPPLSLVADEVLPQIVLLDYASREQYEILEQRFPKCEMVFVLTTEMNEIIDILEKFRKIRYFASYDKKNRGFSIRSIATTVKKILQSDFFGMEKYLMWGTHIESRCLLHSDQRLSLISEMEDFSKQNGVRSTILDRAHTVSEELLMNSVFAAPRSKDGKSLYNHLRRDVKIDLAPEQQPEFKFATDGTMLALSVSDPYGALRVETIQAYLASCYGGQVGIHNDAKGGAGRGLHMIVETADFTVFNINPGSRTEIICFFNLDTSEVSESRSAINIFQMSK